MYIWILVSLDCWFSKCIANALALSPRRFDSCRHRKFIRKSNIYEYIYLYIFFHSNFVYERQ